MPNQATLNAIAPSPSVPEWKLNYIRNNEGFRDTPYKDTKGNLTIGYGFKYGDPIATPLIPADVWQGKRKLTVPEAEAVLLKRALVAEADAQKFVTPQVYGNLSPEQQLAITDMAYNLGYPSLSGFNDMRTALTAGNTFNAQKELLNSKYAREDVPNRAKRNSQLIIKGKK